MNELNIASFQLAKQQRDKVARLSQPHHSTLKSCALYALGVAALMAVMLLGLWWVTL